MHASGLGDPIDPAPISITHLHVSRMTLFQQPGLIQALQNLPLQMTHGWRKEEGACDVGVTVLTC